MDFSLTKEQEMLKKLAAQFAEEELEPVAAEIDAEHRFPTENFAKMAKVGFTGMFLNSLRSVCLPQQLFPFTSSHRTLS